MNNKNIKLYKSRLGMRLLIIIFTALAAAVLSFWGIRNLGTRTRWGSEAIERFLGEQESIMEDALEQFQAFVTEKQLKSTDFQKMNLWLARGNNIGMTIGGDRQEDSPYFIAFSDKQVSVYPYIQTSRYETFINYAAFVIAVVLCILIVTPYIRRILSDIAHLAEEMDVLASGDLAHTIEAKGTDELAGLARNIEAMRISVNELIEREMKATAVNSEWIASLSHDLRTPLTKTLGYLELLKQNKALCEEDRRRYLERAYHAACQVKERSDELFSLSNVEPRLRQAPVEYTSVSLRRLFLEMRDELCGEGLLCDIQPFEEAFRFYMDENDLNRVLDNLTSNFLKYAEPSQPITVRAEGTGAGRTVVHITNRIRSQPENAESSGIGLPTMKRLIERQGGELEAQKRDGCFEVRLSFKTEDA